MISHNEIIVLVHWVYTRAEWKIFLRKENRKKGIARWLIYWIFGWSIKKIPEVRISSEKISIGEKLFFFNTKENRLKRINILDGGKINIMEICYNSFAENSSAIHEFRIPVPKGKLREAVIIQEKLSVGIA